MSLKPISRIYFGYGSNMWLDQMSKRCPESKYVGVGILKNWKWIISERGYANVVESGDEHVYGLLFELDSDDEARLDGYEGVPESYEKQFHSVTTLNDEKIKDVLVYVDVQRVEGGYKAKEEYISRMNKAIDDGLKEGVPNEYVEKVLRPYIPEQ